MTTASAGRRALLVAVVIGTLGACTRTPAPKPDAPLTPKPTGTATETVRTITVLGAGDELLHPQVWAQARKDAKADGRSGLYFDDIFTSVKPAIEAATVAICHLETPLAPANGPYHGYPRFSVPPQIAQTIHDIGYDSCSTASNHTLDDGTAGIKRTLDDLDAAGVQHAGSYRSAADARTTDLITATPTGGGAPVKVAQLSYTFGFNGLKRPAGEPWVANQTDAAAILRAAKAARAAGAQIVVLSLHWGVEYSHTPDAQQRALAKTLLASPDIDLILGCHEHVVQPISKVDGKWVVYGMGNQLARHADPIDANREGIMPEFTFSEVTAGHWRVTTARVIPTWVQLTPNIRVVDLPAALADPHTSAADRATYKAALKRITAYVGPAVSPTRS
ncbi:MAG TPA: CapA family protein [Micromonosporaceae bacterium]|jgi:poly-gamma-glutamate synthesis protein (capsule biosynthesis protein)